MNQMNRIWLAIAGICGIIAPIIAFTCIVLAISYYPAFSWTDNALSDLGIQKWPTATLFNSGLVIGGGLTLIFARGLHVLLGKRALGKIGVVVFALDALALTAIGFFPESAKPMHFYASVAFFSLSPASSLVMFAAFTIEGKVSMGLFTLSTSIVAASVWVIQLAKGFGPNVAIPEAISALSAATWSVVSGLRMLRKSTRLNKS